MNPITPLDSLNELYQSILMDHARHPHHQGMLPHPTHQGQGINPICGDRITLELALKKGKIEAVCFHGEGCMISKASASLLTDLIQGQDLISLPPLITQALDFLVQGVPHPHIEDLACLSGVRQFPARIKCATLSWHLLRALLENPKPITVSTE